MGKSSNHTIRALTDVELAEKLPCAASKNPLCRNKATVLVEYDYRPNRFDSEARVKIVSGPVEHRKVICCPDHAAQFPVRFSPPPPPIQPTGPV